MTQFRFWLALLLVWLAVFFNLERAHQPVNIASFVYVLAGLLAIGIVVVPPMRKATVGWLSVASLGILICLKVLLGYGVGGAALTLTVTEAAALLITVAIAHRIALQVRRFEQSAADVAAARWQIRPKSLEEGQVDMYRELRRARKFGRPLAVVALEPVAESVKLSADRLIEEVRREMIQRYIEVRLAETLQCEVQDFDLVASYEGRFIMLLPETDNPQAMKVAQLIAARVERELGFQLRVGAAAFPTDEITLTGLVERAESALCEQRKPQPAEAAVSRPLEVVLNGT